MWTPDRCFDCEYKDTCRLPGGKCRLTGGNLDPPAWNNDFIVANEIYWDTVNLSGYDSMNGQPKLDKLEFVMQFKDYEVFDRHRFIGYLSAIHRYYKTECK